MQGTHEYSDGELKAHILYKLARKNRWGGKHTELIHVRSALPKEHRREAEKLAKELADSGFLTWLMKTGQIHVSLQPSRRREIVEFVEKYLGRQYW